MKYSIGIDLGGTKTAAGLVDENYNIIDKTSAPTNREGTSEEIADGICALIGSLLEKNGKTLENIEKIGIAVPGAVDVSRGEVIYSCNLPFRFFPLEKALKDKLIFEKIALANDANAAALGEAVAGAAKNTCSSVMITLGTGVGGGVVIDGKLLIGKNGAAAELGHIVIEENGKECSCTRYGCFEAYCGAPALIKLTEAKLREALARGEKSAMLDEIGGDFGKITTRTAFEASKSGDAVALDTVREYTKYLACGITNIINIFQPDVLTIGGGISGQGDYLLKFIVPIIEREQYTRDYKNKTEIKIAALGNDAGIIGAAAL